MRIMLKVSLVWPLNLEQAADAGVSSVLLATSGKKKDGRESAAAETVPQKEDKIIPPPLAVSTT